MQIAATGFDGLFTVETAPSRDERGYFHRLYDVDAFAAAGILFTPRQSGISHNAKRGTLRGLHFQAAPASQAKLVRCLSGSIFDVVVDIRAGSATRGKWFGLELTAETPRALFVPDGFAHGFITLSDDADVLYELSDGERPGCAAGLRWNDPAIGIDWPFAPLVINPRDDGWPDWKGN
ncbi:dTDP-4-dehydrorhamnose 3,5-epimerase family protein [Ferrovibrio terrae]|uniref:dTDP-4-dehydrorhamnose 3,5-epimerase family protein n=1 Tax=Ferrovibrio terrae TaxID=2594003 RepID=UPI003137C35A